MPAPVSGAFSQHFGGPKTSTEAVRKLAWVYIALIFIEGPLRKWVLPGFSDALLLIRDPVVLASFFYAWKAKLFSGSKFLQIVFWLGIVSVAASLLVDFTRLPTTLYGWRTNFMHLPMAIFIARVFAEKDLRLFFGLMMVMCFIDGLLIPIQFYSPAHSWINSGLDDSFTQLGGLAGEFIRPPGIFSFNTGPSALGCITLALVLAPPWRLTKGWQVLRILGLVGVVIGVLFSASRHHWLLLTGVLVATAIAGPFVNPASLRKTGPILLLLLLGGAAAMTVPQVSDAMTIFYTSRIDRGDDQLGGDATMRLGKNLTAPFTEGLDQPFWGNGLGVGTQVGSKLAGLSTIYYYGDAETDMNRHMIESGMVLGLSYVLLRIGTVLTLFGVAIKASRKQTILPLALAGAIGPMIIFDILSQTTVLGFAVVGSGILLLTVKLLSEKAAPAEDQQQSLSPGLVARLSTASLPHQ